MIAAPERRVVAVLFSDLSGFTRLSAGRDPEEVRDLVDALFSRFRVAIESLGGTVDKFIGDAVMAVFGAPVAHADDAARAARAGLVLQKETASYNEERRLDLRLRVGINFGEVLWGSVGGGAPTAMGDAVNVAQRLESAAEPGTVLVSAAVERLARARVRFRPLGPISLRGIPETVEAFEAMEAIAGGTDVRDPGDRPAPLAGRREELDRLGGIVREGRGVVLVEGEAGVGKSRLLAEARRRAREERPESWIAEGRAPEEVRLPLAPFGEILRATAVIPLTGGDEASGLASWLERDLGSGDAMERENAAQLIVLSLGYSLPQARVRGIDAERRKSEAFAAWERWISGRCARAPALLCLEDLHAADPATLELLELLARRAPPGLALLAASRPLPAGALPSFPRLALGDLPEAEAAVLAESVLRARLSGELRAWLLQSSGGHPFYLEELARHLRDTGQVEGDPARLRGAPDRPDGLLGLLVSRLDAFPAAHKEVLKAASVVGRAFWPGILEGLVGTSVEEAIREAARRGLVEPAAASALPGEREYVFRHALLREAAYRLLPKKERQRLHAAAARRLAATVAGGRRVRAMAAAQWEAAG
ncbi:MAG: adenylyl cyclase class-3/4/guanylyl, partial [Planctomycetota bacterium]